MNLFKTLLKCGIVCCFSALAFSSQASLMTYQYYRLVIDSVGSNTDGYSSVNEIQLKIDGSWQINANSSVGNNTSGNMTFGTVHQATVTLVDQCCGFDISRLFNGANDLSWVAGVPYKAFEIGGNGDSITANSIWALFDFGTAPVALEGMRIFGDPWDNGGASGAEAPDQFRIQSSDDGVNFQTLFQTTSNVITHNGLGFDALIEVPAPAGMGLLALVILGFSRLKKANELSISR
jgi:hypothetical protein